MLQLDLLTNRLNLIQTNTSTILNGKIQRNKLAAHINRERASLDPDARFASFYVEIVRVPRARRDICRVFNVDLGIGHGPTGVRALGFHGIIGPAVICLVDFRV